MVIIQYNSNSIVITWQLAVPSCPPGPAEGKFWCPAGEGRHGLTAYIKAPNPKI